MRSALAILFLVAATGAVFAAPPKAPRSMLDKWFTDLAHADSPESAKPIEQQIASAFRQSGSPSVDLLMSRANQALGGADNKTAGTLLGAVTRIAPRYAEGWHARAMLEAAGGKDSAAMLSLQKTVALNPRQFTAMTELAGMLEDYGDKAGALKLYRRALVLDPQQETAARRVKALTKAVEGQSI
jgi:Tfp pilus assembly protein PilF